MLKAKGNIILLYFVYFQFFLYENYIFHNWKRNEFQFYFKPFIRYNLNQLFFYVVKNVIA